MPYEKRKAVVALVVACFFWGCSFAWAKEAASILNHNLGHSEQSPFGPLLILAIRFTLSVMLLFAAYPCCRGGWTKKSLLCSSLLGIFLSGGMVTQYFALQRTTEAVTAFLTSLSVAFVPIILAATGQKRFPLSMWLCVGGAIFGIWLMTGAAPTGFGYGEILSLGCSVIFALYLIQVDRLPKFEPAPRMLLGQFAVMALCSGLGCLLTEERAGTALILQAVSDNAFLWRVLLLTLLCTFLSFYLLVRFQPFIDPARASFIYLAEPVFAAAYAWMAVGHAMSAPAVAGAILIVGVNIIAELLEKKTGEPEIVAEPLAYIVHSSLWSRSQWAKNSRSWLFFAPSRLDRHRHGVGARRDSKSLGTRDL